MFIYHHDIEPQLDIRVKTKENSGCRNILTTSNRTLVCNRYAISYVSSISICPFISLSLLASPFYNVLTFILVIF